MTSSTVTSSCSTPSLRPQVSTDGAPVNIAKGSSWKKVVLVPLLGLADARGNLESACWLLASRSLGSALEDLGLEDQEMPGRSGCGLPGSCHTDEAAACPGG